MPRPIVLLNHEAIPVPPVAMIANEIQTKCGLCFTEQTISEFYKGLLAVLGIHGAILDNWVNLGAGRQ